jgi:perosamine synthetase
MIPIYKPFLNKKTLRHAHDALDSTWISSHGKYLNILKDKLLDISGQKYVILTNNGTTATHLISIGLKYKNPDISNIIVPNNVYIAAWNTFKMNPIYNLIPVDCNLKTWNYDEEELFKTIQSNRRDNLKDVRSDLDHKVYKHKDTAILIVHNVGNIINVPKLKKEYPNYLFVEDNCEGFLGSYNDVPSGSESLMSSVSFFGNKTITAGEGGALFTNDCDIFEHLNSVRAQGNTSEKFKFDKLGYNYRMTNIQAAILVGQLESLDEILEMKNNVSLEYQKNLTQIDGIEFQSIEKGTKHSNWMVGIRFTNFTHEKLNNLMLFLYTNDIETRPMFPPITEHTHYKNIVTKIDNAKKIYDQTLILPSYPELTKGQINYICDKIKEFLKLNK